MKTLASAFLSLLVVATAFAASTPAAKAPEPPRNDFKSYRYMRLRNIFDPTRLRDPASESSARITSSSESSRAPFFALTGTLLRPEKVLGFFTGTSPEMNRVLGPGDNIGGYKIRSVSISGADLEKDGKTLALPVGKQIPLTGSVAGTVQPYFAPEPVAPSFSSSSSLSSSSSPSPTPGGPPGPPPPGAPMPPPSTSSSSSSDDHHHSHGSKSPEEILRKMMERAQKERTK
jgi:hypothetical protein